MTFPKTFPNTPEGQRIKQMVRCRLCHCVESPLGIYPPMYLNRRALQDIPERLTNCSGCHCILPPPLNIYPSNIYPPIEPAPEPEPIPEEPAPSSDFGLIANAATEADDYGLITDAPTESDGYGFIQ